MSKKKDSIQAVQGWVVRYSWFNRPVFYIGRLDKVLTRDFTEAKVFPTQEAAQVAQASLRWFAAELTGTPCPQDEAELVEVK